ncbi:MAG: YjgP/YjgQ family permease, partial [Acidobacteria bacterium]|nr:YjgP/YjgQ family permease [Acidobacteriota bacterium]
MFGILGRYVLREVIPPFCLAQVVFTFLLMLDPITKHAEELIGVGVDLGDILQILVTALPYSLGLTIPMALLVGVLMGLGRLSGDREMVAMQACGIGVFRILSPLLVLAALAAALDCYLLAEAVPNANRRLRETVFRVSANRAEGEIKPRVFQVDRFPRAVLYVREVAPDGWRDVFLADVERPEQPDVYVAEWGRVAVDEELRTVAVALRNGERHRVDPAVPSAYEVHRFEELTIQLDASALFPDGGPARDVDELSIPELREEASAMRAAGISPHQPIMAIHE